MNRSYGAFTIGTDPEFFLTKGAMFKSAIPLIKGTKDAPIILQNGAGLQHDNVALEFASPVSDTLVDFLKSIRDSLGLIGKQLPKGYGISTKASASFPRAELFAKGSDAFGCSPDYNAWTRSENSRPELPHPRFRSCGGHIHIGYIRGSGNDFLHTPEGRVNIVKTLDASLGIISVMIDNSKDAVDRRLLYGKAGCHRPTEYGVEYRVLSNFWLKSPKFAVVVFNVVEDCLRLVRSCRFEYLIKKIGESSVQDIINGNMVEEASNMYRNYIVNFLTKGTKESIKNLPSITSGNINSSWGIKV
jgi:hypothetical protein